MAKISACLFDLDGVIVDTAKYHYLAWRRLCNELGFDLTHEENESLKGISRAESLDILLKKGGASASAAEKQAMMQRKNQWYLEHVEKMAPEEILPGVEDFLKALRKEGYKIALGSASKNSVFILEKIKLHHYFDVIIDGTKVTRGKPDPQTFTMGAEALEIPPKQCVVFEDAKAGIAAALSANMYAVGVGDPEVLHRAALVIPGFQDVTTALFNEL